MARAAATFGEFQKARDLRDARRMASVSPSGLTRPATTLPARGSEVVANDQAAARELRARIQEAVQEKKIQKVLGVTQEALGALKAQRLTVQGSAWLSYLLWEFAIYNIIDTFGFSLLALSYHYCHYGVKMLKFAGHEYLCAPGEDGLMGTLPPPRFPLGIVSKLYALVNMIALGMLAVLTIFILVGAIIQFMLPLILAAAAIGALVSFDLGALGNYIEILFSF